MSILIAMPCYNGIADRTGIGLFNLAKFFQASNIRCDLVTVSNSSLISKCRSRIANAFINETNYEYLLFIDSDIGFTAEDARKLLELQVSFATAPYSMKSIPPVYNFGLTRVNGRLITNSAKTAVQVEHIGCGFMLIHRSVFEQVAAAYPELRYKPAQGSSSRPFSEKEMNNSTHYFETEIDPVTREQISEDFAFCRRARSVGVEIWMRIDTQLTHCGNHIFKTGDLRGEILGEVASYGLGTGSVPQPSMSVFQSGQGLSL